MKKALSILLVLLMLTSVLASCGGNDVTTTETPTTEAPTTEAPTTEAPTTETPTTETPTTEAPTTEAPTTEMPTTEAPTTEAPTTIDSNTPWSSKTDIRDTWSGKTLNVACTTWYATGAPWAMPEVVINEEEDANFGVEIQEAVLERNKFIEDTYDVKVNWIDAGKYTVKEAIDRAILSENVNYDLAMPRQAGAQVLVVGGYLYDLANRELLDFSNSYYNKEVLKEYTAKGHTFFVSGGISTMDYNLMDVLYFNKSMLGDGSEQAANELYQLVRDGKWTYGKLIEYASAVYSDDGDGKVDNEDTYGFYASYFDDFFNYFGVKTATVNQSTGEWELTINDERADDIVDVIRATENAEWRTGQYWDGSASWRFNLNRLLFMVNAPDAYGSITIDYGIVPFPMLNEEQGRYYTYVNGSIPVLMCIPKITQDREMSEYFADVLSWTGEEYFQKEHLKKVNEQLKTDANREMFTDYILTSLSYDQEYTGSLDPIIDISSAWMRRDYDFEKAYNEASLDALKVIASWNKAWGSYTEN